jgi:hypothetical protein
MAIVKVKYLFELVKELLLWRQMDPLIELQFSGSVFLFNIRKSGLEGIGKF